jgi:cell division protein ZapA
MSDAVRPITVTIMDKEYLISCSEDEREQLHSAAELINQKMQELKRGGKIIGTERIAVMTALNIAHELQACREQTQNFSVSVDSTIRRLQSKIDEALTRAPQMEM